MLDPVLSQHLKDGYLNQIHVQKLPGVAVAETSPGRPILNYREVIGVGGRVWLAQKRGQCLPVGQPADFQVASSQYPDSLQLAGHLRVLKGVLVEGGSLPEAPATMIRSALLMV